MPNYLSNIDPAGQYGQKSKTHDDVLHRVYVASLRSGQNVKYLTCAMPNHWTGQKPDYNHYGCIAGYEETRDYSLFWREYYKLIERYNA